MAWRDQCGGVESSHATWVHEQIRNGGVLMFARILKSRRLADLREARDRALQRLADAKARRDTRDIHKAQIRATEATLALMRAEVR